ncbi:MAG: histidine phosphatase family protein [Campylobacteraceae bacterium]|nr:histidine phosphatase family protein [Campylobacteraceae bacterium]
MKKLFIIRHSKAEDINESIDDFDRELTQKGIDNTKIIAKYLKNKNIKLDYILTSQATRTMQTSTIIAKELSFKKNLNPNQYIYEPYVNAIIETMNYIHDSNDTVFLVGHNPGVSALAYMLCDSRENMNTSSIIEIEFNTDSWVEVAKNNSTFISYTKVENIIL